METFARLFIIQDCLFLKDYKKDLEKAEREASYSSMSTTSFSFPDFPAAASPEGQTPSSISPPHPVISVYYFPPSSIVLFTRGVFLQQLSQFLQKGCFQEMVI